jgi:hypothetical protein
MVRRWGCRVKPTVGSGVTAKLWCRSGRALHERANRDLGGAERRSGARRSRARGRARSVRRGCQRNSVTPVGSGATPESGDRATGCGPPPVGVNRRRVRRPHADLSGCHMKKVPRYPHEDKVIPLGFSVASRSGDASARGCSAVAPGPPKDGGQHALRRRQAPKRPSPRACRAGPANWV